MTELEILRSYLCSLDEAHLAYAQAYADELSMGEPPPSSAGLERERVREIRHRIWREWRRRIELMPGTRR